PYAGVTVSWNDYEEKVKNKFASLGHELVSAHRSTDLIKSIEEAEVIVVGGGNTFHLAFHLQTLGVIPLIRQKVEAGTPYIGWSAGSNVACPAITTSNDMPIIQPPSFGALELVNFQINPHFTEAVIPNHGGETREARILEYLEINPDKKVIGLREGSLIQYAGGKALLLGNGAKLFTYETDPVELNPGDSLSFLF
ncbi:MAG TPA: dipeptidase PepE, partial [Bacteroidales bacterium]|nr:dipeptidase PepE [Bacteroidales bacterium]